MNYLIDLEFKIHLAIVKGRNIVYYKEKDPRTRSQYMHVLRSYRRQLVKLLKVMPKEHRFFEMFLTIVKNIISPEIEPKDCTRAIKNLKIVLEQNGIEIK